jgi:hypothetical protein
MRTIQSLPSRYALILDPAEIRKVLSKIEALHLPRRECHPLDRYTGKKVGADLARYDAEIDKGSIDDEPLQEVQVKARYKSRATVVVEDDIEDEWDI